MGSRIGSMTSASGTKMTRRVWRYRRKKYASRPHFLMTSRSLNRNIANNQPQGLLGGGSVRSRSGTRYVLGLLSPVSRVHD
jgi:hypothetical protein